MNKEIDKAEIIKKYELDKGYKNSGKVILGIDPSLTATGLVLLNDKGQVILSKLIKAEKMVPGKKKKMRKESLKGVERLIYVRNEILKVVNDNKVDIIAIEHYSFGSRGRSVFNLGELGGVIRISLTDLNKPYFEVSPSSLKSFIANNGSADKEMMRQAVKEKYHLDINEDNICDAFGLARMCLILGDSMPKYCAKGGATLMKKIREKYLISIA